MQCSNCSQKGELAFTLTAHPPGDEEAVVVGFCSSACLEAWTTTGVPEEETGRSARAADPAA